MDPCEKYLRTLLTYYEEEIAGEAYFIGLIDYFDERNKLALLSKVERCAAESIVPLLEKYGLNPRKESVLEAEGKSHVERHASLEWQDLMRHMVQRYPGYLEDFAALESIAPVEDLDALGKLTQHEIAAIEFAEKELAGDADSLQPLLDYFNAGQINDRSS